LAQEAAAPVFTPITQEHVAAADALVGDALTALSAKLTTWKSTGDSWATFLRLDDLNAALEADSTPSSELLQAVLTRLRHDAAGMETPEVVALSETIRARLQLEDLRTDASLEEEFDSRIGKLVTALNSQSGPPSPDTQVLIRWMDRHRQAPNLVAAFHRRSVGPNVHVRFSHAAAAAGFPMDRRDRGQLTEGKAQGTFINANTSSLKPTPTDGALAFGVAMQGTYTAATTTSQAGVKVQTEMKTQIESLVAVAIDEAEIQVTQPDTTTSSALRLVNVSTSFRGIADRIGRSAAEGRFNSEKVRHQRSASEKAKLGMANFNDTVKAIFAPGLQWWRSHVYASLLQRDLLAAPLDLQTTNDAFRASAAIGAPGDLGPSDTPPSIKPRCDLSVQLHSTAAQNALNAWLAGESVSETQAARSLKRLFGVEASGKLSADNKIIFADQHAIHIEFQPEQITLSASVAAVVHQGETLPGASVTVRYRISITDGHIVAQPMGPPECTALKESESAGAEALETRLVEILPSQIDIDPITLPARWSRLGSLAAIQADLSDGWLTLAWKR